MSIKRLALCRSRRLSVFVLCLRFAGQDVTALIEREGSQAFAHATTSGSWCAVAGAPGRSWPCAGALPFRLRITSASSPSWCFRFWMARRWMSFLHPVAEGWAPFASIAAWPSWNPRLTTKQSLRCARLSAMRSVANAAVATRSMPFAICRQTPARCGAMRLPGRETPSAPLELPRSSIRI